MAIRRSASEPISHRASAIMSAAKATGSAWKLPPDSASSVSAKISGLSETPLASSASVAAAWRSRSARPHHLRLAAQAVGVLHPLVVDAVGHADVAAACAGAKPPRLSRPMKRPVLWPSVGPRNAPSAAARPSAFENELNIGGRLCGTLHLRIIVAFPGSIEAAFRQTARHRRAQMGRLVMAWQATALAATLLAARSWTTSVTDTFWSQAF